MSISPELRRKSSLVDSKLDQRFKGRGFESRLITTLYMEIVSKYTQSWLQKSTKWRTH